jgi:predicted ArsR family transcriptional regulator
VLEAVATAEAAGRAGTITDLAEHLGGHPNTTRVHLAALVDERLVDRVTLGGGTRGRPAHGHRLTERGSLVLEAVRVASPVSTDELVSAMAEHLSTTADPDLHARAIGRLWATQLLEESTGPGRDGRRPVATRPVDQVVSLLTTAGFSPRLEPSGDVALRTCPVLSSAREHPEVVCTMHEEMLRATLDRAGARDVEVGLVPFARAGACLVRLSNTGK